MAIGICKEVSREKKPSSVCLLKIHLFFPFKLDNFGGYLLYF